MIFYFTHSLSCYPPWHLSTSAHRALEVLTVAIQRIVVRENHLQSIVYRDLGITGFEIRLYIHSICEVFVALTTGKGP